MRTLTPAQLRALYLIRSGTVYVRDSAPNDRADVIVYGRGGIQVGRVPTRPTIASLVKRELVAYGDRSVAYPGYVVVKLWPRDES